MRKTLRFHESTISYRVHGSSDHAVLFYHGDGQNHTSGDHLLEIFPKNYARIGIDRPGHGDSEELTHRTMNDECAIISAIVRKEKIKKVILIGHSSGAAAVISYALTHPVQSLVLINPLLCDPRRIFWYLPLSLFEKKYLESACKKYDKAHTYHCFGTEKTEQDVHDAVFASTPTETLRTNLGLFQGYDVRNALRASTFPTLIIQGRKGILSMHRSVRRLVNGFPHARLVELAQGTHNLHIIRRQEVVELIKKHRAFLGA